MLSCLELADAGPLLVGRFVEAVAVVVVRVGGGVGVIVCGLELCLGPMR